MKIDIEELKERGSIDNKEDNHKFDKSGCGRIPRTFDRATRIKGESEGADGTREERRVACRLPRLERGGRLAIVDEPPERCRFGRDTRIGVGNI